MQKGLVEKSTMNNVLGTGLLIPNKCQILRHVFWKPFILALGRRPHFQEYQSLNTFQIQKVLLAACQRAPQRASHPLTVLEPKLIPKSYFYNSKRNFSSITCGSSEPSQRQDLYLSFSCPRHPSQSVPGTSQALKGYPTEPNQFSLPLGHVGSKGETCSFPSSQFFMQMADVWPLTHFGLHDSRIIHSLPSHLPTLLPVKSKSTSSSKAVGIKKQRHYFANKDPSSQSYGFSSSHVRVGP